MKKIREIIAELGLLLRLDTALCDKLEELDTRVQTLEKEVLSFSARATRAESKVNEMAYLLKSSLAEGKRS